MHMGVNMEVPLAFVRPRLERELSIQGSLRQRLHLVLYSEKKQCSFGLKTKFLTRGNLKISQNPRNPVAKELCLRNRAFKMKTS